MEAESPPSKSASPSPGLLPTPVSCCFSSSERSFSNISCLSSQSSLSNASSGTRSSSFSTQRRRGYVRPQGAAFAQSAKNRESVMSLGSIAHLQYYFARTGLLDGKGGQLAKKKENGAYDIPRLSLGSNEVVESPIEEEGQLLWEAAKEDGDDVMLPPTVSTYSHRTTYVPPPPDQKTLKKDLVDALENALQALESCEVTTKTVEEPPTQGFYEIQGLHVLDTTTLAIRAARLYYTLHPYPARLNSIRPDHQIRKDLYDVLEVLKKCASRNFAGGIREEERLSILVWVSEVGSMVDQEARLEEAERQEREGWQWMNAALWAHHDRAREINFMRFLQADSHSPSHVPAADEHGTQDALFIRALADGRQLCQMHNAAVARSRKPFGEVKTHHTDVAKPYRRADNLRYWLKAAELRWEVRLKLDVMGIVHAGDGSELWDDFEQAVLRWCKMVREEITRDWHEDADRKVHARAKSLAAASPMGSPSKLSVRVDDDDDDDDGDR